MLLKAVQMSLQKGLTVNLVLSVDIIHKCLK